MNFMNEYDIEEALARYDAEDFPYLAEAAEKLHLLMRWTNRNSDGWPYWKLPAKAADKLMTLIQSADRFDPQDVTAVEVKKALTPIKSFLTRQGEDPGAILNPPPPPCSHPANGVVNEIDPTFYVCTSCGTQVRPVGFVSA